MYLWLLLRLCHEVEMISSAFPGCDFDQGAGTMSDRVGNIVRVKFRVLTVITVVTVDLNPMAF